MEDDIDIYEDLPNFTTEFNENVSVIKYNTIYD